MTINFFVHNIFTEMIATPWLFTDHCWDLTGCDDESCRIWTCLQTFIESWKPMALFLGGGGIGGVPLGAHDRGVC